MIVVSDTSPLLNLAVVGKLDLLQQLYGGVVIPGAVAEELSICEPEQFGLQHISTLSWVAVRQVQNHGLVAALLMELDGGEAEAIVAALETGAHLLLMDERRGRRVASRFGLRFSGVLGIVVEAKRRGLVDPVKPILDDLVIKAGLWVGAALYQRVLQVAGE